MRLVFIEWLDATLVSARAWEKVDKLDTEGCHLYSGGILVKENKLGYFIAGDVDPLDSNKARCVSFIPKGMVRKIQKFEVKQ